MHESRCVRAHAFGGPNKKKNPSRILTPTDSPVSPTEKSVPRLKHSPPPMSFVDALAGSALELACLELISALCVIFPKQNKLKSAGMHAVHVLGLAERERERERARKRERRSLP